MSLYTALKDTHAVRGLGWASIGIGLAELFAASQLNRAMGLEDRPSQRGILRAMGVRELMHALSILTETRPTTALKAGIWSRVAGDALDTALLGVAAMKTKRPARLAAIATSVMIIGALDLRYAQRLARHRTQD